MPPVALSQDQIDWHRGSAAVSFTAAHRYLTTLRNRHRDTQNVEFLHDLTDVSTSEFDWKAWVSQRPDAEDIVGPGIYRFAFVWVVSTDTNLHEKRGDFLVSRVDGADDIRLHPQARKHRNTAMKEALIVRGSWETQWSPSSTAMVRHGALVVVAVALGGHAPQPQPPRPLSYQGISQSDGVGKNEAVGFLANEVAAWYALPSPRAPFRRSLTWDASASTQGQFNWPYYVQRREWFQTHFAEGLRVASFELAWSDRHKYAVFVGCRSDGEKFTVNPLARTMALEFSWGWDGVLES